MPEREPRPAGRSHGVKVTVVERHRGTASRRLAEALARAGVAAASAAPDDVDPADGGVTILLGNAGWYPRVLEGLAAAAPAVRSRLVVWHFEPLPFPAGAALARPRLHAREVAKVVLRDARATDPYSNGRLLRRLARRGLLDLLVVTSTGAREYLAEVGLRAEHVPLGYHAALGCDLGLERDVDVVFVGALDVPRRKRALRALRRSGLDVVAVGGWGDDGLWGERRTHLLNRAKVFLNLSRYEGQYAGQRLTLGMANRSLVVSEPMYRPEPFVPGTHYVEASLEEMPAVVERYLADSPAREEIAARGHRFVTTELTYDHSVARLVELIRA